MTINERVSPKRLAEIIARAEVCDDSVLTDYRDIESMARELQQFRAAEPVAWVMKDDLADTDIISTPAYLSFSDAVTKTVGKLIPLYAAPQVTSVPDEWRMMCGDWRDENVSIHDASGLIVSGISPNAAGIIIDAHNACRAAMLNAAPAVQAEQQEHVSQPYTLPLDYLQGYKDGCEWAARMAEANHPQTGDWLFDDPIELAKAIRKGPDMLPAPHKQDFREIPNSSTNNCRENADSSTKCWCHTCRPVSMTDMRFVVCPDCGNKRCPHANDHRNACTGSNEPGQEGSAYPAAPKQEAE